MKKYRGASPAAVLPSNTDQVSRLLRHCNERRIAVVPQGGNTGLVGGSVPAGRAGVGEVVLSTSRMKNVVSFDPLAGVLTCEAGCILETLDAYLAEQGFAMPLDLGAKGSCQIGGNISTNAGGLRLLRYGSLHGSVLGLEVVLADGTVLDLLSANRKDNTGYALRHLFVGAEGTLGVVTRCSLVVPPRPASVSVALLALSDFRGVESVLSLARGRLAEVLSAVEFMDKETVALTLEKCQGVRSPFPPPATGGDDGGHKYYVLIETSGSDADHDAEKMEGFLEAAMEHGSVVDGAVAQDLSQLQAMWSLREHAPVAVSLAGYTYKYDVSIPVGDFKALADETRRRLRDLFPEGGGGAATVVAYGHLGDGNLHLNVCVSADGGSGGGGEPTAATAGRADVLAALEPFVFEWVVSRRGSISAEHGVGQHKRGYLSLQRPEAVLGVMRDVKGMLDPRGIMNPFKVLPPA
ncbi:unnamed protein product [Ectocarpus sp. 4 AP-2014]